MVPTMLVNEELCGGSWMRYWSQEMIKEADAVGGGVVVLKWRTNATPLML